MAIPTCAELASDRLVHRYDDMFNPPGLTNFLGAAQVDHDVVGVRSVNFPPFSQGDTVTGRLFVDGRLARSLGGEVTVVWRPDRVERTTRIGQWEVHTVTACPPGETAVVVDVRVRNLGATQCSVRLGLGLVANVTHSPVPWREPEPPSEFNLTSVADARPAVVAVAPRTAAVAVQGIDRPAARVTRQLVEIELAIAPGETARFGYVHVVAGDEAAALAAFDRLAADVPGAVAAAEAMWDAELRAAFTPGNSRWSGHLPELETSNAALRRLYHMGAVGVMWFRRDSPASVLGRVYDTLMPRYWQTTTFIWDYALSSIVHALLDPTPMRRQLTHWIGLDIHTHFGTEWQHGAPAGYWYAVNDYAMTRLVREYVRFTGDTGFLAEPLAAADGARKPVAEHVVDWARAWEGLRGRHGLADYGEIDNLLECVSSYTHEVASFNATNVWALRAAAELCGDPVLAATLRDEAAQLAKLVGSLYVPGGYWEAGQPDGSRLPVKHCLDFANVAFAMADDLSIGQRAEMVDFFVRELQTESWMRALSPWDPDASFSLRPDHQWNGAYTAWPADAARALYDLGRGDLAAAWLPGLARSANQGPFGQAHFTAEAVAAVNGGARKSPPHEPYLIDWACSSSGAYVGLVLEKVFGLEVPIEGEPTARPALADLDPSATLSGLTIRGQTYSVSAAGLRREG
jgi:hypothetical protein